MFRERKAVGCAVANECDATPDHEGEDDAKAEKKDKTHAVGGVSETVTPRVDSINAFGCE